MSSRQSRLWRSSTIPSKLPSREKGPPPCFPVTSPKAGEGADNGPEDDCHRSLTIIWSMIHHGLLDCILMFVFHVTMGMGYCMALRDVLSDLLVIWVVETFQRDGLSFFVVDPLPDFTVTGIVRRMEQTMTMRRVGTHAGCNNRTHGLSAHCIDAGRVEVARDGKETVDGIELIDVEEVGRGSGKIKDWMAMRSEISSEWKRRFCIWRWRTDYLFFCLAVERCNVTLHKTDTTCAI